MKYSVAASATANGPGTARLLPKRIAPRNAALYGRERIARPTSEPANRWIALAVILVGPFLGVIDFFIANIGVPSIRTSLGASFSEIELSLPATD
jgi:hypothetical protein